MKKQKSMRDFPMTAVILVKKLVIILMLATCHFIASIAALFVNLGASLSRLDTGRSANLSEIVAASAMTVLYFPILLVMNELRPMHYSSSSIAGDIPFILNSLLWGTGIYYFGVWVKKKYEKRRVNVEIPAN